MARARDLANDYLELCLTSMYNTANEAVKNVYISDKTPTLKNHLFQSLQRTELEPHLTATEGKNMTRCAITTRKYHTTVMKNAHRVLIEDSRTSTIKIQESVRKWPHSIECSIFKPETIPYTPFAKQCILDTCIQGLTPRIYKKSIEEWVTILSKATRNVRASKDIKEKLNKLYKEFRQAIYIRAFTLQRLNRQLVANREGQTRLK